MKVDAASLKPGVVLTIDGDKIYVVTDTKVTKEFVWVSLCPRFNWKTIGIHDPKFDFVFGLETDSICHLPSGFKLV